jgi:uncharacterized repeat protein (TIGR03803 family)
MKLGIIPVLATILALGPAKVSAQPAAPVPAFTNPGDGSHPCGGLVLSRKTLYGTTSGGAGGFWGCGTVFRVNTDAKGFTVLHRFSPLMNTTPPSNSDGAFPRAGLVLSGKTLYGTAAEGGSAGLGTVFKVNTDGRGFAVLHSFTVEDATRSNDPDGARPVSRLVLSGNTLYGTTERGGYNEGTVFKVSTDGTGFATLHRFTKLSSGRYLTNSDGAFPQTDLVLLGNMLYGTAWAGGTNGIGTVFKLKTDGTGFNVLHSFSKATNNDFGHESNQTGAWPEAGLLVCGDTLYGAASQGGGAGNGTLFRLKSDGTGFAVLHSFTTHGIAAPDITNEDGEDPRELVSSGTTLYGVASENGRRFWGTIFKVNRDGTGFTILRSLGGSDGAGPRGRLLLSGNTLYGATDFGGSGGGGTVFKVGTDGAGFTPLHSFTAIPLPPGLTD